MELQFLLQFLVIEDIGAIFVFIGMRQQGKVFIDFERLIDVATINLTTKILE